MHRRILPTQLLRWAINALLISPLLSLLLVLLAPRWLGLELLSVASGSMGPTIPLGAVVFVQSVDTDTILPGEIITFRSPEAPDEVVTHRVLEVVPQGEGHAFRTKGDANPEPDLYAVPAADVTGRAVFHLPYLGFLAQYVRTRQGWLALVVAPALALVLFELANILRLIWMGDKTTQESAHKRQSTG